MVYEVVVIARPAEYHNTIGVARSYLTPWLEVAGSYLTPWLGVAGSYLTPWLEVAGSELTPWLGVARGRGATLSRVQAPRQAVAPICSPHIQPWQAH